MPIRLASLADFPEVRRLCHKGHHVFLNCGMEDLPDLLRTSVTVVGEAAIFPPKRLWGVVSIRVEDRPNTLPANAPTRAVLRAAVLDYGRPPSRELRDLLVSALDAIPVLDHPVQVTSITTQKWLLYPLQQAGFEEVEKLRFYVYTRRDVPWTAHPAHLRSARQDDLAVLARLDSQTFESLWHMGEQDLLQLFFTCRIQVAELDGHVVGYSALSIHEASQMEEKSAQLIRLAVHPRAQKQGIGGQLLADAIACAHAHGAFRIQLNTQESNRSSQKLYEEFGFRHTGPLVPVMAHTKFKKD